MKNNHYSGLVLIDKSQDFTSHHVVSYIRKLLKNYCGQEIKVGHLGTLDPFASGLLPILIGGATRLSDEIMDGKKQYLFQLQLGIQTDTLDCSGQIVRTSFVPENYREKIQENLSHFIGEIEQVPPVYSALKMQGKPLYEYMRATGKLPCDIETKKRKIYIHELDLMEEKNLSNIENNIVTLRVMCGKGTYVRSLARDIAISIGTVAYCSSLRREYVEPWHADNALLFSENRKPSIEELITKIITPEEILPKVIKVTLPEFLTKLFCAGNIVTLSKKDIEYDEQWYKILNSEFCFAETYNLMSMYYCLVEKIDDSIVKIKPNKKIFNNQ